MAVRAEAAAPPCDGQAAPEPGLWLPCPHLLESRSAGKTQRWTVRVTDEGGGSEKRPARAAGAKGGVQGDRSVGREEAGLSGLTDLRMHPSLLHSFIHPRSTRLCPSISPSIHISSIHPSPTHPSI